MFFEFYHTNGLWLQQTNLFLLKISQQKVDLGEDYTQKVQENFKKRSTSDTTGDPLLMSHPVFDQIKKRKK